MDQALERVRKEANNRNPRAGRRELERALRLARFVAPNVSRFRNGKRELMRDWLRFRRDLNELARSYRVPILR